MNMLIWKAEAAAGILVAATAAAGPDDDDWSFTLRNRTSVAVTQFNTRLPNGQWSSNWLRVQIAPGQDQPLHFTNMADSRCTITTRVTFADASYFEDDVEYCGKDFVTVNNEEMTSQ
jgi:hypothetical protein